MTDTENTTLTDNLPDMNIPVQVNPDLKETPIDAPDVAAPEVAPVPEVAA